MGDQKNEIRPDAKYVMPTLFVGLGGTGAEVMMRIRRRIISQFWGIDRVRLDVVGDFPAARFLHIDLDQTPLSGSEKSADNDPVASKVKLSENERLVKDLDFNSYVSGGRLETFPHIRNWLAADRLSTLPIDTTKGAGQIRAISRLYFYDKVSEIRNRVESNLRELQAGIAYQDKLNRLGIKLGGTKRRVVIIASGAGGTGSGTFLDMGYLSKALNTGGTVDLILFLPTGYLNNRRQRVEANSYAALMELDACMSKSIKYIDPTYGWGPGHDELVKRAVADRPFNSVFLADTQNMAGDATNDVNHLYHMVADILFEDFMPGEFADRKRSIDVNHEQDRMKVFYQPLGDDAEGAVEPYVKVYSAFGQCALESPQNLERFARHLRESQERVRALFQIMDNPQDCTPSVKETEAFLKDGALKVETEEDNDFEEGLQEKGIPEAVREIINNAPCGGSLIIYKLVRDLLGENNALDHNLLDYVQEKFRDLLSNEDPETKKINIQTARKEIMHEVEIASGDKDSGKRWREIEASRGKVLEKVWTELNKELYARLDDRKRGGLDYVVELIKAVQGRLENPQTGIIGKLKSLVGQYTEILDLLLGESGFNGAADRLAETKKGLFGGGVKKAEIIAQEMQAYLYWALRIKLLIKATEELARLYKEIHDRLGNSIGADDDGTPMYDGLLGQLMESRSHVRDTLYILESMKQGVEQQQNEQYPMRFVLPVNEDVPDPDVSEAAILEWANDVFGVTGSLDIFEHLKTQAERTKFVNEMLNYADKADSKLPDIRITDLMKKMKADQRRAHWGELMRRAMSWAGLTNLSTSEITADNYTVLVASGDDRLKSQYQSEIQQGTPDSLPNTYSLLSGMSENGKILVYNQIDGFMLDNIKDLRTWRESYNQEGLLASKDTKVAPIHTSKMARYRDPIIPSPDERRAMKESIKVLYGAILLGVLRREVDGVYTGVFNGQRLGCGTEVARRNGPFTSDRRQELALLLQKRKFCLKTLAQRQSALIAWQYYLQAVYPKGKPTDNSGVSNAIKGLAHLYCEQLQREWAQEWHLEDFLRETVNAETLLQEGDLVTPLLDIFQMEQWVDFLPGSKEDAFADEVDGKVQREKCVLKKEVFEEGWLEQHVPYFQASSAGAADLGTSTQGAPQFSPAGMVPPPPPPPVAGGVCFQVRPDGWLTPLLNGTEPRLGWHGGQAYWLPTGGQPLPVTQLSQAAPTPPPPGAGLVWITDPSGWQAPQWQAGPGQAPVPAQIGWYGNPLSPTACWIAGGQSIPFTLAQAPVNVPPSPSLGGAPVPPPPPTA